MYVVFSLIINRSLPQPCFLLFWWVTSNELIEALLPKAGTVSLKQRHKITRLISDIAQNIENFQWKEAECIPPVDKLCLV